MRTVSVGLKAAMSATPRTLAWLGKFAFSNGTVVRASTSGLDVTFDDGTGSATWRADKAFRVSALTSNGNGDVPDGEITAPTYISDSYDEEDVFAGTFEDMQITLWMVDWSDPADGSMQIGPYADAEIGYDDRGRIAGFEVRGILQRAKQIEVEELAVACRSNVGDPRPGFCRLPLYPDDRGNSTAYDEGDYIRVPDGTNYHNRMFRCTSAGTTAGSDPGYNYTVGATTTDGSASFIAEEAWVRSGVVATRTSDGDFTGTLTESRAVDDWFANNGIIKFTSGLNTGLCFHVRAYTSSTKRIQLWSTARWTVAVSDTFEIMPGCNQSFAMCLSRFSNTINFRGENYLPGPDFLNGAS